MTDVKWIDTPEVAKIIRKELKAAYPDTKFSVRSSRYAGGSSIRVHWTDGPTDGQVKQITSKYEGATFDGMIDLQSYVDHEVDGERVHYGSDYIFEDRDYSREFLDRVAAYVAFFWDQEKPEPVGNWFKETYVAINGNGPINTLVDHIREALMYAYIKDDILMFTATGRTSLPNWLAEGE